MTADDDAEARAAATLETAERAAGVLGPAGADFAVLFASAFGAATILPFYSEVFVVALLAAGRDALTVWGVATLGNTLGAVLNWWVGLALERWRARGGGPAWLHPGEGAVARAQRWYARFGVYSLLLAWLPVGGDALTFVAGLMRVHIVPFLLLVGLGKAVRYAVIVFGADAALS